MDIYAMMRSLLASETLQSAAYPLTISAAYFSGEVIPDIFRWFVRSIGVPDAFNGQIKFIDRVIWLDIGSLNGVFC